MAKVIEKNMLEWQAPSGRRAYVWTQGVHFDRWPKPPADIAQIATYVNNNYTGAVDLALEGFAQFADPEVLARYAGTMSEIMLDESHPRGILLGGTSGMEPKTGVRNGEVVTIQPHKPGGNYLARLPKRFWAERFYTPVGRWDDSGKIERVARDVYNEFEAENLESPQIFHVPAGLAFIHLARSAGTETAQQ